MNFISKNSKYHNNNLSNENNANISTKTKINTSLWENENNLDNGTLLESNNDFANVNNSGLKTEEHVFLQISTINCKPETLKTVNSLVKNSIDNVISISKKNYRETFNNFSMNNLRKTLIKDFICNFMNLCCFQDIKYLLENFLIKYPEKSVLCKNDKNKNMINKRNNPKQFCWFVA